MSQEIDDERIARYRNNLQLHSHGHPNRASSLRELANLLYDRFNRRGTMKDLDEALALNKESLLLLPEAHPDRVLSLNSLANSFYVRFQQSGTPSDLEEALALQRSALELLPNDHPNRDILLNGVALFVYHRFRQLGTMSDLEEAISLLRKALELRPQEHPLRATSLSDLANSLHSRFKQLGSISDLEEALVMQHSALQLRPPGHPDRLFSLGNLANYLNSRFKRLRRLSDLNEVITLRRETLGLHQQGHPLRALSLNNLSCALRTCFIHLGTLPDLEEAITLQRSALELRPKGHRNRRQSLYNLTNCLRTRYKATQDISDLQETFELYSQFSDPSQSVSSEDLGYVRSWILAAEEREHPTTVLAYQTFLRLTALHFASLPSLPHHLTLFKKLTKSIAVDAFSACIRHGNRANAVELLEQGRAVFWARLSRIRSPLDEVISSGDTGKMLAEEFMQSASLLCSVLDGVCDSKSQHDSAWHLNIKLQATIVKIRELPGLSRFLLPPLFTDLRIAASCGPVIIVNASQYGCDALIVLFDRDPIHVALPITKLRASELCSELRTLTTRARFNDETREFMKFLRQLWDEVVSPIVETLQQFCPRGSRIWWCPTAEFSLLPLHAAGPFRKGQSMFSDLYISSYTPTLTALIRARQKRPLDPDPSTEYHRCLVVGQAQAPGQCKLVTVNTELSSVSQRLGAFAMLTTIQDDDATIVRVAEELGKNEFVHFATASPIKSYHSSLGLLWATDC